MIRQETVLILGAGASMPYQYPSGALLLERILGGLISEQKPLFNKLRDSGFASDAIVEFREAFKHSGFASIDAFLQYRQQFLRIGKTAIAQIIIDCEKPSAAVLTSRDQDKWYRILKDSLMSPIEEFSQNRLRVITFNYDRSLEHFLYTAFKHSWAVPEAQVVEALAHIDIFHMHGKLGHLPWQNAENHRPYGSQKSIAELARSAELINVVHESVQRSLEYKQAKMALDTAKNILFLGFGYHDVNLDLLGLRPWDPIQMNQTNRRMCGTRHGLTSGQCKRIIREFPVLQDIAHIEASRLIHEFLTDDHLLNN